MHEGMRIDVQGAHVSAMALLVMLRAGGLCAATGRCGHGSLGKRMGPSKVQSSCVPPTVGPELLMRATSTFCAVLYRGGLRKWGSTVRAERAV